MLQLGFCKYSFHNAKYICKQLIVSSRLTWLKSVTIDGQLATCQPPWLCTSSISSKHLHDSRTICHGSYFALPVTNLQRKVCLSSVAANILTVREGKLSQYVHHIVDSYHKDKEQLASETEVITAYAMQKLKESVRTKWPLVSQMEVYNRKQDELEDLRIISKDPDMKDMAMQEIEEIEKELEVIEQQILQHMAPPERADHNDIILELSAGVGGQEAMLFTNEMFDMYGNYASYKGWSFDVIEMDLNDIGGLRKASASIGGQDVYMQMKYEGGVHRVQRVPKTEKSGRIHTSTMTVAVLPQPTEIDVELNPKDLKIETFRSSGPGGQHVNTTDSAVRVKHLPTGIVAECQTDRSQIKNKQTALKVLRSRIYERMLDEQTKEQQQKRKFQTGSAGRSDKIRTYNYNQDRITDHRLGRNVHNIDGFLAGGNSLDDVITDLQELDWRDRVLQIVDSYLDNTNATDTAPGKRRKDKS